MIGRTKRWSALGALLLVGLALVAWWQWFPRPRGPGYHQVATWGAEEGPGALQGPIGITLLGDEVFVSDSFQNRIVVFDRNGGFLRAFGERGAQAGRLDRPTDLAVAPDGTAYVADFGNGRVQVFARDGD